MVWSLFNLYCILGFVYFDLLVTVLFQAFYSLNFSYFGYVRFACILLYNVYSTDFAETERRRCTDSSELCVCVCGACTSKCSWFQLKMRFKSMSVHTLNFPQQQIYLFASLIFMDFICLLLQNALHRFFNWCLLIQLWNLSGFSIVIVYFPNAFAVVIIVFLLVSMKLHYSVCTAWANTAQ